ncbi:MAG: hypothetical protein RL698_631 [Pseudomonadota bacterium]|jgi:Protein of unknown function (DUF1285)
MARAGFWAIENMTIRFGRDGRWYSDDEPIENRRIADLFSRHVTRDGDGGWWLVIGDEHARIVVDDTAWVVVRVDGDPARGFTIELNDGIREELSTGSLRLGDGHVLYCDVKGGAFPARFLRGAQAELLGHVEARAERFVLPLPGGAHQEIRPAKAD